MYKLLVYACIVFCVYEGARGRRAPLIISCPSCTHVSNLTTRCCCCCCCAPFYVDVFHELPAAARRVTLSPCVVAQLVSLCVHAPECLLAQGGVTLTTVAAAAHTNHITLLHLRTDDKEGRLCTRVLQCVQHC